MGHSAVTNPVDWNVLRAATDNDKAALKEVVSIYLHQGVKNVKALRSAVQRQDPDEVAMLAHKFLGSSRFFGATEIGKPLAILMKMGRSHQLSPNAAELVELTEKEFSRIKQFVMVPHG
jgi:HPt (histidine-containing phosphotransfer) domain-containing protein